MAGNFLQRILSKKSAPVVRLTYARYRQIVTEFDRQEQISCRIQAVRAIMPFWIRSIALCGDLTGQSEEHTADLVSNANTLTDWCRMWRDGEPVDKSRLREVWKPVSFVNNAVSREGLRDLAVAPLVRNMHPIISGLLYAATDERKPTNLFELCYETAFLRTKFPFVSSDLMSFASEVDAEHQAPQDKAPLVYAHAARDLKVERQMQEVFDDAYELAGNMGDFARLSPDDFDWEKREDPLWYRLRAVNSKRPLSRRT